jgi:hypothetical protein
MSTPTEFIADLVTALDDITGGARRKSDELRDDPVPVGGNSYQIRLSAAPLGRGGSFHANDQPTQLTAVIVVYHYLDLDPVEQERDYTEDEMLVMQSELLFHGLWIAGFPNSPANALTTVQDFYDGEAGEPAIPVTFARNGRVISFEVAVAVNLHQD